MYVYEYLWILPFTIQISEQSLLSLALLLRPTQPDSRPQQAATSRSQVCAHLFVFSPSKLMMNSREFHASSILLSQWLTTQRLLLGCTEFSEFFRLTAGTFRILFAFTFFILFLFRWYFVCKRSSESTIPFDNLQLCTGKVESKRVDGCQTGRHKEEPQKIMACSLFGWPLLKKLLLVIWEEPCMEQKWFNVLKHAQLFRKLISQCTSR